MDIAMEPTETVVHEPGDCLGCPNREACMARAEVGETRTVVDAVVAVSVTAHKSLAVECPVRGARLRGAFPAGVDAPVQYGGNLRALAVALNTVGAVSVGRTQEILSGVFGVTLSQGTVANMVARCARGLSGVVDAIRRKLAGSSLLHGDETGTRVEGRLAWVHCASDSMHTHLTVSQKRGKDGMDEGGVFPGFEGIAVHDCWAPYWRYPRIFHSLCCAHLLRELTGVLENDPGQGWAADFKKLLLDMKKAKEDAVAAGERWLEAGRLQSFRRRYKRIIARGYAANPPPEATGKRRGRAKMGKVLSLIGRLDELWMSVCLFAYVSDVPFDNNQAERDLRMVKTKTKVSGCFRSMDGAKDYLKIMSYVGTAKKHGVSAYEAIRCAVSGNPLSFA
jgi:transposase